MNIRKNWWKDSPKDISYQSSCTSKFTETYRLRFPEKQIKDGPRQKKIDLINSINNKWRDLYMDL
jgi:predicted GIY-YIG superfamily endonuclease